MKNEYPNSFDELVPFLYKYARKLMVNKGFKNYQSIIDDVHQEMITIGLEIQCRKKVSILKLKPFFLYKKALPRCLFNRGNFDKNKTKERPMTAEYERRATNMTQVVWDEWLDENWLETTYHGEGTSAQRAAVKYVLSCGNQEIIVTGLELQELLGLENAKSSPSITANNLKHKGGTKLVVVDGHLYRSKEKAMRELNERNWPSLMKKHEVQDIFIELKGRA